VSSLKAKVIVLKRFLYGLIKLYVGGE